MTIPKHEILNVKESTESKKRSCKDTLCLLSLNVMLGEARKVECKSALSLNVKAFRSHAQHELGDFLHPFLYNYLKLLHVSFTSYTTIHSSSKSL